MKIKISIKVDNETTIEGMTDYDPKVAWKQRGDLVRQVLACKREFLYEKDKKMSEISQNNGNPTMAMDHEITQEEWDALIAEVRSAGRKD